jgi:hypothetical protein
LDLPLIGIVSTLGPVMGHVEQAHPLETQQAPVIGTGKLTLGDGTNGTSLANKGPPFLHLGELEAGRTLSTSSERGAHAKAADMVGCFAGQGAPRIIKGKPAFRKITVKDVPVR